MPGNALAHSRIAAEAENITALEHMATQEGVRPPMPSNEQLRAVNAANASGAVIQSQEAVQKSKERARFEVWRRKAIEGRNVLQVRAHLYACKRSDQAAVSSDGEGNQPTPLCLDAPVRGPLRGHTGCGLIDVGESKR